MSIFCVIFYSVSIILCYFLCTVACLYFLYVCLGVSVGKIIGVILAYRKVEPTQNVKKYNFQIKKSELNLQNHNYHEGKQRP